MTKETAEAITIPAKYIFLDIVGFTQERSVEAQSDLVHKLNDIVNASIKEHETPEANLIFIPTGDGMCIALLNIESPYDIHLLIALSIVKRVHEHNEEIEEDKMRQFQVRIGLNANTDNLVIDINRKQNIAGAGISDASRIMNLADGNQILVGRSVFDTLRHREKYMSAFKEYLSTVKHDIKLQAYQLVQQGHIGLNIDTPKIFEAPAKPETKLPKLIAYYFAHAIGNRELFLDRKALDARPSAILLYFLAKDSVEESETSEVGTALLMTHRAEEKANTWEQLDFYGSLEMGILSELFEFIRSNHLSAYSQYFEGGFFQYQFINSMGVEKLRQDWPDIYAEFLGRQLPDSRAEKPE